MVQTVYDLSAGHCLLHMQYTAEEAYLMLREHLSDEDDLFGVSAAQPQGKFGLVPPPHYFGTLAVDWQAVQQLLLPETVEESEV